MTTSTRPGAPRVPQLPPLASDAVLVHIGPHKTGTTAIQSVLADSRRALSEFGVAYPGKRIAHHPAARALRRYGSGWRHDAEPPPDPAVWTDLARAVRDDPGRVVISSEFFADADAAARAQLVADLGPERVHLLVAARNAAGIAVSTWQQVVRTYGQSLTLEEWLEKVFRRDDPLDPPNRFWERSDPAILTAQWATVVPPECITVVVLDERDRRLLPATFEQLLDLPAGFLADRRPRQSNRGLSAAEAALIRQVNAVLQSRLSWADYSRMMRRGVIQRLLETRTPGPEEGKEPLPAWAVEQAVEQAERSIAGLSDSGVRIVGDLASLRSVPQESGKAVQISAVPVELAAEAVVGAIAVATRNHWSLDKPVRVATPRPAASAAAAARPKDLTGVPTKQIAATLARRVIARARRGRRR